MWRSCYLYILLMTPSIIIAQDINDTVGEQLSTVNDKYRYASMPSVSFEEPALNNPALYNFRLPFSISSLNIGFQRASKSKKRSAFTGEGEGVGKFWAETYLHHNSSLITGCAGYSAGTVFNLRWNEMGNSPISPYLLADAVGGNLRTETYSFNGGYANHKNRLSWGVFGGYTASLSYRNTDPRPKNLKGDINISAGIGYEVFRNYVCAVSAEFNKIREHSELSFTNELGQAKIYHLTGLGSHYDRFAGTGSDVYNDFFRFSGSFDVIPVSNKGFFGSIKGGYTNCKNIISDLNNLPLASYKANDISVSSGWTCVSRSLKWGISALWRLYSLTGSETIFGDASSGIYPKIGELDMLYNMDSYLELNSFIENRYSLFLPSLSLKLSYQSISSEYHIPLRFYSVQNFGADISAAASIKSNRWLFSTQADLTFRQPVKSNLIFNHSEKSDEEIVNLEESTLAHINALQSEAVSISITPSALFSFTDKYAIKLSLSGTIKHIKSFNNNLSLSSSLSLIF
ncbi:MAG: hypothetical protein K2N03_01700 [Muribaculaceae bacterium]|nr:hypothetical protein [Muribaculaceae bacterium]